MRVEYVIIAIVVVVFILMALWGCDTKEDGEEVSCPSKVAIVERVITELGGFSPEDQAALIEHGELTMRMLYRPCTGDYRVYSYSTGANNYPASIVHDGTKWVATGCRMSDLDGRTWHSTDGFSWTEISTTNTNSLFRGIAYTNGFYVTSISGSGTGMYYSSNANVWTAATGDGIFASGNYPMFASNSTKVMAITNTTATIVGYTTDGNAWTAGSTTGMTGTPYNLVWDGSHWIAGMMEDSTIPCYSEDDGATWDEIENPPVDSTTDGAECKIWYNTSLGLWLLATYVGGGYEYTRAWVTDDLHGSWTEITIQNNVTGLGLSVNFSRSTGPGSKFYGLSNYGLVTCDGATAIRHTSILIYGMPTPAISNGRIVAPCGAYSWDPIIRTFYGD